MSVCACVWNEKFKEKWSLPVNKFDNGTVSCCCTHNNSLKGEASELLPQFVPEASALHTNTN